ncbi:MAG: 4Fe-4S binding protein [Desulfobacterales bacterium]|nr:4Fe-4S binding protein [Desulfobacterales bacterium]
MRIVTARRISQIFFLVVFLWFCEVATLGEAPWQLRGWPVNLFLYLDPLAGLGMLLTTHTLYAGLLWGVVTVVLTILLGRFFCGWLCPFGTIHQFVGFVGKGKKKIAAKIDLNRYHRGQSVKYGLLIFILTAAMADLARYLVSLPQGEPRIFWLIFLISLAAVAVFAALKMDIRPKRTVLLLVIIFGSWLFIGSALRGDRLLAASLQSGLLDPISLLYRSVNLVLLPLLDGTVFTLSASTRYYQGAWLLGVIFLAAVLLNLKKPRFYCRYVCPLGALFGVLGRFALWRIGKSENSCGRSCHVCETNCEGACAPSQQIRISECVLCCNCLTDCFKQEIGFRTAPSASGEILTPDVSRRAFLVSALSGAAAIPMIRLSGQVAGPNWTAELVRPPGALDEQAFLDRCIKCGQCMRLCPTNVIHPAALEGGLEGLWTPILNFRVGTSGCQLNCIACGHICPTGAIRPITLDERLGRNRFAEKGPIKIGTAFIDRGRCLPWAMDRPCIVCQENCPVSPKAITTRNHFSPVEGLGDLAVQAADMGQITIAGGRLEPGRYTSGDFYCRIRGWPEAPPRAIIENAESSLTLSSRQPGSALPPSGSRIEVVVRLQQPYVNPRHCIGCGICEHECPVRGKRAIRVTADNETRTKEHALTLSPA